MGFYKYYDKQIGSYYRVTIKDKLSKISIKNEDVIEFLGHLPKTTEEAKLVEKHFRYLLALGRPSARSKDSVERDVLVGSKFSTLGNIIFYDFPDYIRGEQKEGSDVWKGVSKLFRRYVLYFFGYILEEPILDPSLWFKKHFHLKQWLAKEAKLTLNQKPLSLSYQEHCISSLNLFYKFLMEINVLDRINKNLYYCENFQRPTPSRDGSHVLQPQDFLRLSKRVRELNEDVYHAMVIMYHSGLRIRECLGLNLASFRDTSHRDDLFKDSLVGMNNPWIKGDKIKKIMGVLWIDRQLVSGTSLNKRDTNGNFIYYPLKNSKKIKPGDMRIIPIFNQDFFESVGFLMKRSIRKWRNGIGPYGDSKIDYLFFEDLTQGKITNTMKRACHELKIFTGDGSHFTSHCLRHSCCTLYAKFDNYSLGLKILGHKSMEQHDKYIHIDRLLDTEMGNNKGNGALSLWGKKDESNE